MRSAATAVAVGTKRTTGRNVTHQLIEAHRVDGKIAPKEEIALRIDQTLTQDTAGTKVMLEFEAMGVPRVKTEISAQYVDHNLLQTDFKNADDHLFLLSVCRMFGVWYSRPGNGVSHPRRLKKTYPGITEPENIHINTRMLLVPAVAGIPVELEKEPNIKPLPSFEPLPERIAGPAA